MAIDCGGQGDVATVAAAVDAVLGARGLPSRRPGTSPADQHEQFVADVAEQLPEPVVDYVWLQITCRR
jgi:hypothetical protein